MFATYFVVGLLGLLAASLVGWVIAGVLDDRRKVRAATRVNVRFQRVGRAGDGGDEP